MNKKEFQAFFEAKNFIVKGMNTTAPSAYGMIGEYPVIASYTGGKKWITLLVSVDMTSIKSSFKELRKENKQFSFMLNVQSLKVTLNVKDKSREEDWRQQTSALVAALKQKGVRPDTTCGICGRSGCDAVMFWDSHYSPVHAGCVHTIENQAKEQVEQNEVEGNYIAGIIGAILGAFVGVIPSLITIIFANSIWSVLFALIQLCICFGYKLFKGKTNKFMIVLTIILSVLSVFLIEFEVIMYALFIADYGIPFKEAFVYTLDAITRPNIIKTMMGDMLQYLIFVALGIWIAWGQITKTNGSLVKGFDEVKTTMAPYGDGTLQSVVEEQSVSPYGVMHDVESR